MKFSNLSYWEKQEWFADNDVTIIGSGIVGLSTAIFLKRKLKHLKITVLDKGSLPDGGSTKNAGFACFGSLSELHHDLNNLDETAVFELIQKRYKGLLTLRELLGDENLGYESFGGYELFTPKQELLFNNSLSILDKMNSWLEDISGKKNVYSTCDKKIGELGFSGVSHLIYNSEEGQINTGNMMKSLLQRAMHEGIDVLFNFEVKGIQEIGQSFELSLSNFEKIKSRKVVVATNAFASQLLPELMVFPGRAQVLITKEIDDLKFKGCYHLEEGYYYFRNVGKRVLFGGGRNIDKEAETTFEKGVSTVVQESLEELLKTVILPSTSWEVDRRWSGTLGLGPNREPIVSEIRPGLYAGVRMGGMGVAIGSGIGLQLSEMISSNF